MDNTQEYTCLSLCSGYGGLELGIRRAVPNLRTVAYVEIEAFACANLVGKMEAGLLDAAPVWTDIKTFDGRNFRDCIHFITAGYPCQGESHAGKRLGQSDPRWLWPYIERIIEAVQPLWFFGENVSGHLSLGFPTVYRSLRNLGYKVEAGLFTAAECGDSMEGERLFILGQAENNNGGILLQLRESQQADFNTGGASKILGKTEHAGLAATKNQKSIETPISDNTQGKKSTSKPERANTSRKLSRFPAFRGQQQYEWEKPRVIESRLGGAVNGTASRVDRLRLLGNGVVPQQVELAFRELMKLFEAKETGLPK